MQCTCLCAFCNTNIENEWHTVLGCDQAIQIWRHAELWSVISNSVDHAKWTNELVLDLLKKLDDDKQIIFAMMLWCLIEQQYLARLTRHPSNIHWNKNYNSCINGTIRVIVRVIPLHFLSKILPLSRNHQLDIGSAILMQSYLSHTTPMV